MFAAVGPMRFEVASHRLAAELALFRDETALRVLQRQHPDVELETLLAEGG